MNTTLEYARNLGEVCAMRAASLRASFGEQFVTEYSLLDFIAKQADFVWKNTLTFHQHYVERVRESGLPDWVDGRPVTCEKMSSLIGEAWVRKFVQRVKLGSDDPVDIPPGFKELCDAVQYYLVTDLSLIQKLRLEYSRDYVDKILTMGAFLSYCDVTRLIGLRAAHLKEPHDMETPSVLDEVISTSELPNQNRSVTAEKKCRKVIPTVIAMLMVFLSLFTGCGEKEEEPPVVSIPKENATSSREMNDVTDTIPNMTTEDDRQPRNFLDETETEYLLPTGVQIPKIVPSNALPTATVGGIYSLTLSGNWNVNADANTLSLFHNRGISVKLIHNKIKGSYKPEEIRKELNRFSDSFITTNDPSYRECFLNNSHVGYEVSFNVLHDEKPLHIQTAILASSSDVLVYTVSYFEDSDPGVYRDLVENLLTSMKCKTTTVIFK